MSRLPDTPTVTGATLRAMRSTRRGRIRLALLATAAFVAVAAGLIVQATGALERMDLDTVDTRFAIRGSEPAPASVAVVGIDDKTFSDLRLQFPFPRRLHAQAIDRLKAAGAKVIAYDVQFSEPTNDENDLALLDAMARAGNVVLGTSEVSDTGEPNVIYSDADLRQARARVGNGNVVPDPGGTVRRFPYEIDGLTGFAVVAARAAGGHAPPRRFKDGGAWIDYPGPPGTIETVSFADLVRGRVPAAKLRGRIVVVGATAPSLQDVHPTSVGGRQMPGPEIQAAAMASVLAGFPLRQAGGWITTLAIILAGLVAPAASISLVGARALIPPLLFAAAYAVAAQLAFEAGRIIGVVPVALALVVGTVGALAANYTTELRERRRVREVFARFVPAQVADEVIDRAGGDLRLGGVQMEGTVMFCDLRGFTSAAESLQAAEVIDILNRYLTEMSEAILGHGGTVVSYMGDGIMAIFGAPIEQPDHAARAVAAAREMLGVRLPAFNAWMHGRSIAHEDFRMGIGLCSGPVMSGNVGSERRLEYTVVGDTTNTASRLEGMTKGTPHMLFVSDATRAGLDGGGGLVEVGELEVRGRKATMRVWTLGEEAPGPRG